MSLMNRIAKKLRRRTRVKETYNRPKLELTKAELLVQSWYWNPTINVPIDTKANIRSRDRLRVHMLQWKDTPVATKVSRQVRRRLERQSPQSVVTS